VFSFLLGRNDLDVDDDKLLKLVQKYRGCIRDIIMNIHQYEAAGENTLNLKDMTNFEVTHQIYTKGISSTEIDAVYKDDAGLVGFIVYENMLDELYNKKDIGRKVNALLPFALKANDYLISTSIIEQWMYETGSWKMFDLINILRICGVGNIINSLANKNTPKDYKYRFSQALSKISHKNIMCKKLKNIQSKTKMSFDNVMLLADIVYQTNTQCKNTSDEANVVNTYVKYFAQ
jgi:hypothetical protein